MLYDRLKQINRSVYKNTSQENSDFTQTDTLGVGEVVLNDDVSEQIIGWRETHCCDGGRRQYAVVLNVMVLFVNWSGGRGIIVG